MEINFKIKTRCSYHKITNSWVIYSKKYDVSAYGRTKDKARRMFDYTIQEILLSTKPKYKK